MKKYIEWTERNDDALADVHVEQIAREFLESDNMHMLTSSGIFIIAIQALCAEGVYNPQDVIFMYNDKDIIMNDSAIIKDWPHGFADINANLCERCILGGIHKGRKKNK